jgi:hypothetical protein
MSIVSTSKLRSLTFYNDKAPVQNDQVRCGFGVTLTVLKHLGFCDSESDSASKSERIVRWPESSKAEIRSFLVARVRYSPRSDIQSTFYVDSNKLQSMGFVLTGKSMYLPGSVRVSQPVSTESKSAAKARHTGTESVAEHPPDKAATSQKQTNVWSVLEASDGRALKCLVGARFHVKSVALANICFMLDKQYVSLPEAVPLAAESKILKRTTAEPLISGNVSPEARQSNPPLELEW